MPQPGRLAVPVPERGQESVQSQEAKCKIVSNIVKEGLNAE